MSLAVVSDIHLQLRTHAEFEEQRFTLLFDHLIAKRYPTVVFNGDLLDHARPTLEEIHLLQTQITRLSKVSKVFVVAGNHEAVYKELSTYDYLQLLDCISYDNVFIDNEIRVSSWAHMKNIGSVFNGGHSVLITHLRSNMGLIREEYDIKSLSDSYDLVILGDIHQRYSPFDNVHYTSSPYSTKFLNKPLEGYGYILINTEDYSFEYVDLDLPCKVKRKCSFKDVSDTLQGLEKHLVKLEVTGALKELQALPARDNVIYLKVPEVNLQTVQSTQMNSDVTESLRKKLKESDVLSKYKEYEKKIDDKIEELK